jgi:hypothetical protein
MLSEIIDCFPEESFLIADGFDSAIIGIETDSMRLIYSTKLCIDILCKDMSFVDALEYFNYNVLGAYMGNRTPIWCNDMF